MRCLFKNVFNWVLRFKELLLVLTQYNIARNWTVTKINSYPSKHFQLIGLLHVHCIQLQHPFQQRLIPFQIIRRSGFKCMPHSLSGLAIEFFSLGLHCTCSKQQPRHSTPDMSHCSCKGGSKQLTQAQYKNQKCQTEYVQGRVGLALSANYSELFQHRKKPFL